MKLYINTKKMTFEEEGNQVDHEIILEMFDEEIPCYDHVISLSDDDKFIKDTLKIIYKKDIRGHDTQEIEGKIFMIREQISRWSFPLFEIIEGEVVPFDYKKYVYFSGTDRRMGLARKINQFYNAPSELKILRKTLKFLIDELKLGYPSEFAKMDKKIEEIISKNPKDNN